MRAMPSIAVLVAADAVEVAKLVPVVAEHDGPFYPRVRRAEVSTVFDDRYQPQIGQEAVLRDGEDVTLTATGVMLARALEAAE